MAHPSTVSRNIDPTAWASALDSNETTAKDDLGAIRTEYDDTYRRCEYRYVMNNSGTALVDGDSVVFNDSYASKVTGTHTLRNKGAGVAFGAIAASSYGYIQITGYHDAVRGSTLGAIASGDRICLSASVGKVARSALGSAATQQTYGFALADDNTTNVACYLQFPR